MRNEESARGSGEGPPGAEPVATTVAASVVPVGSYGVPNHAMAPANDREQQVVDLQRAGWDVRPVGRFGPLVCGCPGPDREADLLSVLRRFPTAQIAVAAPPGVVVVECVPSRGFDAHVLDVLPPTLRVSPAGDPSGGHHALFWTGDATTERLFRRGLDLLAAQGRYGRNKPGASGPVTWRGPGAAIMVPPSMDGTGVPLQWANVGHLAALTPDVAIVLKGAIR